MSEETNSGKRRNLGKDGTKVAVAGAVQKWRRTTGYLITAIRKVIVVKSMCDAVDGKPVGSESIIFTTMCEPGDMQIYQLDRIITVLGTDGVLSLVDSNVCIEILDGRIVGGDITRNKEIIQINQAMQNGKRVKIGQTSLKSKGDHVRALDALTSAWEKMGLNADLAPIDFDRKKLDIKGASTSASMVLGKNAEPSDTQIDESHELPSTKIFVHEQISENDELTPSKWDAQNIVKFVDAVTSHLDAKHYVTERQEIDDVESQINYQDILVSMGLSALPDHVPQNGELVELSRAQLVYVFHREGIVHIKLAKHSAVIKLNDQVCVSCVDPDL